MRHWYIICYWLEGFRENWRIKLQSWKRSKSLVVKLVLKKHNPSIKNFLLFVFHNPMCPCLVLFSLFNLNLYLIEEEQKKLHFHVLILMKSHKVYFMISLFFSYRINSPKFNYILSFSKLLLSLECHGQFLLIRELFPKQKQILLYFLFTFVLKDRNSRKRLISFGVLSQVVSKESKNLLFSQSLTKFLSLLKQNAFVPLEWKIFFPFLN
jgi:hypothetical protein